MILAIIISQFVLAGGFIFLYLREKRRFFNKLHDLQVPRGEDQLSELGQVTQAVSSQIGQSIVLSLKQTAFGQASGAARQEKAIDGAIVQDMIGLSNPLMGAAIKSMPTLAKWINKHPDAAALAAQKLAGVIGGHGKSDNGEVPVEQLEDSFSI